MDIKRTIVTAAITLGGLGVGAGQAAAGSYATPSDPPPPPPVAELAIPDQRVESTTCEGNVSCKLLESVCGFVGGTYTGWTSRDHGHTHGICTWPGE